MEKQIQWVLLHVQGGAADVWKENVLEELEAGELEFEIVREFLAEIKKEFGGVGKGSGVKKAGAGRKNNGGVCARVQESSEGKWIRRTTTGGRI